MAALHNLQRQFLHEVYADTQTLSEQLAIYRRSIFGGLQKALDAIYPVCRQLVGEAFFEAMCLRYIRQTPSVSRDINLYGRSLIEFTEAFSPAKSLPYLPDVMRLEWAWHHALQYEDEPVAPLQDLLELPDNKLLDTCLVVPKTVTLIDSDYPVLHIWQVNQPDYTGDQKVNLEEGEQRLRVYRQQARLIIEPLSRTEWQCLLLLQQDAPLSALQEIDAYQSALVRILQMGLIVGIK